MDRFIATSRVTKMVILGLLIAGAAPVRPAPAQAAAPAAGQSAEEHAIAGLLAQLGDANFALREAATEKLETMGLPAYRAVKKARAAAGDPEVQSRLERLEATLSKHVLWNGTETLADYALRIGIHETQRTLTLGDKKVPMKLVLVPAGEFVMGSPENEEGRQADEISHTVRLTRFMMIGATPVTQAQWHAVMGTDPSGFKGDDLPVERISWNDAMEFCQALSKLAGNAMVKYRLPTEAEWEFACRAGTKTAFNFGPKIDTSQENYKAREIWEGGGPPEFRLRTTQVEMFKPNSWGIYDMHGNVMQWCSDWLGPYPQGSVMNPTGPLQGDARVLRGGSWTSAWSWCRSAKRESEKQDAKRVHVGMRVATDLQD